MLTQVTVLVSSITIRCHKRSEKKKKKDIVRSLIANLRATAAIDYEPILRDTFYLNNRGKAILYVAPTEGSLMKGVEEIKEVREDFNATPTVLFIGNNVSFHEIKYQVNNRTN